MPLPIQIRQFHSTFDEQCSSDVVIDIIDGNLRDYPLADCKFAIEQLADRYAYIDRDRVGIYGHSGGGMMAAAAILTYPDFFKVAVAASGNYDNNIYTKWWGEMYHGVKMKVKKDADGIKKYIFESKIPTIMELAANLKGKLLLVYRECLCPTDG